MPISLNAIFLPKNDSKAWKGFWNTFNSHTHKQNASRAYGQHSLKKFNKVRWSKFYKRQIPERLPLNEMKLAGLYVDCFDGIPLRPNKIFNERGAVSSIFLMLKDRLEGFAELHSTIDRSIRFVRLAGRVDNVEIINKVVDHFRNRGSKRSRS